MNDKRAGARIAATLGASHAVEVFGHRRERLRPERSDALRGAATAFKQRGQNGLELAVYIAIQAWSQEQQHGKD